MPSVYDLKPRFQALLRPACRWLAERGVTANQVTVTALLLCVAHGLWIWASGGSRLALGLLPLTLLLRMGLNAIDGMLAREHGMQSRLGAYLNELADVAGDAALYLPFAAVPGIGGAAVAVAVVGAALAEMAGVMGPSVGASRRYDGPFGKSDRAVAFGLLGLALALGFEAGGWATPLVWGLGALALVTAANRVRKGLAEAAP